ncbi:hypothetical protein GP486_005011 [Trichoglossum hirsutum]|uniref:Uncharacterized protein n=1 Tax=Trichoglossum hirsutum TaxID=265104 RepID=A0A9P8RN20_9PEZI|nr:hypothetical protein GP486_005011 [Trichoglossum hirsutum]
MESSSLPFRFNSMLTSVPIAEPIVPLPEDEPREKTDTGVRFTQWGPTSDRLYTGSSDGMLKSWNVKRATEDALVADVANIRSVVMSGAFSPDHSRLLVGDGKGSIHILTADMSGDRPVERMNFEPAEKVEEDSFEGCKEADRLLASGEIMMHNGRPYQGPNYRTANVRRRALKEELDSVYERIHESLNPAFLASQQRGVNSPPSPPEQTQNSVKYKTEEAVDDSDYSMDLS